MRSALRIEPSPKSPPKMGISVPPSACGISMPNPAAIGDTK
jgi:hypothetical protein